MRGNVLGPAWSSGALRDHGLVVSDVWKRGVGNKGCPAALLSGDLHIVHTHTHTLSSVHFFLTNKTSRPCTATASGEKMLLLFSSGRNQSCCTGSRSESRLCPPSALQEVACFCFCRGRRGPTSSPGTSSWYCQLLMPVGAEELAGRSGHGGKAHSPCHGTYPSTS